MLKNKTKIIAIFLTLILLFSATCVFAENETNSEVINEGIMPISSDTNTNEIENSVENPTNNSGIDNSGLQGDNYKKNDVYLTDENVTIDYIVDGNLFVCADTVTINSQIGGDAFILAKKIIINKEGYVFSNLFAISDSIEIKGVVYDVFALAKNLTISNGYIYRDVKASCETLNINGTIGRNAFINCPNINFNTEEGSKGVIYGDLNYSSNSEISIPENVVTGKVIYTPIQETENEITIQSILFDLGSFIAFVLIIWLICLILAPKFLNNTNSYVGKKSIAILGFGLLALISIPIACIILILLQLTIGFSFVLLAIYILALVISKSLFTIIANNYICSKLNINKNLGILGMLIISSIVVWAISQIPYVGGFISFIIIVLGLGILVYSIFPKKIDNTEVEKQQQN